MIKLFAKKITLFLIFNKQIEENDFEMYMYAYETLIAFIVNVTVILAISCLFEKFTYTLWFLCWYCPIRQYAGGYHADDYRRCLLVFLSIYLLNIGILETLICFNLSYLIIGGAYISFLGILILAPIEHRNNPLSSNEVNHYKKVVRRIGGIGFISILIGVKFEFTYKYALYLASVIICVFIMIVLAIIKERKVLNL
ncbi:accessory gene regulator B family protein (plasmid) [Paraclostridium sordellii]|uniref:accessory gene regulator ArgB-like protein n=1 Tax=Paraclostridium sordellii TaxID=1505 RepID=UPI0005E20826|nr:accessory gene regulator B family protein [Paeniclostridium sordellii]CEP41199.1 accessory gene regulator protein B [[Clostridium] sordellii] [Paeniclostridium sordellii]